MKEELRLQSVQQGEELLSSQDTAQDAKELLSLLSLMEAFGVSSEVLGSTNSNLATVTYDSLHQEAEDETQATIPSCIRSS